MIAEAIASMFSALTLSPVNPKDPAIVKMLGGGARNTAGVTVTEEKVMALPAIKRGTQIIYDKLFGMPWYIFKEEETGRTWDRSHPSWRCVNWMANSELSAPALRAQLVQWAMTWGNGCAYISRPNWPSGPVEMFPLLPDRTRLIRVSQRMATAIGDLSTVGDLMYETKIGGDVKLFSPSEIFHIKGLGPNPYWGWDIIELLAECFAGAMAKDEFSNRFFSNGANPVGFIQMEGSLDEESEETYMQSLSKAMSGLGKAHKLILLEEGAKFTPVTIDPIKSQMLEGKQFDVRSLAMAIGIKVHKLIDGANSAFASLEQANHEHKDDDIIPWINKCRIESDRKLLTSEQGENSTHCIDVDDESLDWVPFQERSRGCVELYNNGLITKDEGRRKVNFGPSKAARAKDYKTPANIVFEDDQAMIGARQSTLPSASLSTSSGLPEVGEPYPITSELSDTAIDCLQRIEKRITAQAKSKAKDPKAFLSWLDALTTEQGPKSIQSNIDKLYSDFKVRMNTLAATKTEKELADAI